MNVTPYIRLARMDRPIGTFLVAWPALWALVWAAQGLPNIDLLVIFMVGAFTMRSAGCVINDIADRNFDGHVERTKSRPLATGETTLPQALVWFFILLASGFIALLMTDWKTVAWGFGAAALAIIYPFMKRYTHFPQVVLGAAFAWSVPMAFSAQAGFVPADAWLIYFATVLWTVAYDTQYAMVDRDDDLKIGIKSTAVFFGRFDLAAIAVCQAVMLGLLVWFGMLNQATWPFFLAIIVAACHFAWQFWRCRSRDRANCFAAFLSNNQIGAIIFIGTSAALLLA
ncbi:4-hydroxybenzoate octaprenyltransferase [Salinibius halmophilus]|uniref:4-hydroxybenzoate octaprenyltransferase n=1 Tax=Salinibius halmophilus TaxID=1853216 RepID=UPI000E6740B7|nr:4-hydroxybenzoate octaprenyltransferase [Salinibius halmophilus]